MEVPPGPSFRVTGIRPWSSENRDAAPQDMQAFFVGQTVTPDDLRALAVSFGAEVESMVEGAARHQATIRYNGHHYDLDLEPAPSA